MNTPFVSALKEAVEVDNLAKIKSEAVQKKRKIQSKCLNDIFLKHFPRDAKLRIGTEVSRDLIERLFDKFVFSRKSNIRVSPVWSVVFTNLDQLVKAIYSNENTSENIFSKIRSVIKSHLGPNSLIYKASIISIGLPHERRIERRQQYAAKVSQLGSSRRTLDPIYFDEVCQVIDKYLFSDDPICQVIAIMLATGSRLIEVLHLSNYFPTCLPNIISIQGIAKKDKDPDFTVVRPLFHRTCEDIVLAVDQVRSKIDTSGDNTTITCRYASRLPQLIAKAFPYNTTELTSHKLRYISSNMAYLKFGNGGIETLFIRRYLGHVDNQTSLTYQCINCTLDPPPIREVKEEMKEEKKDESQDSTHSTMAYPELRNTTICRNAAARAQKEKNIIEILRRAKVDGTFIGHVILKRDYGYGSVIVDKVFKAIKKGDLVL